MNVSRVRDVQHLGVLVPHARGAAARIEKYIANSAAKNMSSLESHTIVPTLTMLGRVSEWIRLLSMAEAAVTRSLLPRDQCRRAAGGLIRHVSWPGERSPHRRGPSLECVQSRRNRHRWRARRRGYCRPPFTVAALFTQIRPDQPDRACSCWSPPRCTCYGVHRLRAARRPLAGRPHASLFLGPGLGSIAAVTVSGLRRLRHHAAVGAHGPAHGAVDGRADLPRAGRAGHARAAHAARPAPPARCSPCCTAGSPGC